MKHYKLIKSFEYKEFNLYIEFSLLDDKYIAHKIFKNGRLIFLRTLI